MLKQVVLASKSRDTCGPSNIGFDASKLYTRSKFGVPLIVSIWCGSQF